MKIRIKIQKKFLKYYNDTSKRLGFIPCDIHSNIKKKNSKPNPEYEIAQFAVANIMNLTEPRIGPIDWFGIGDPFERRCELNKLGQYQEVPRFITKTK